MAAVAIAEAARCASTTISTSPAYQKRPKDRVGRQQTFDDIRHYQRMIVALSETGKVMEEVDKVGVV